MQQKKLSFKRKAKRREEDRRRAQDSYEFFKGADFPVGEKGYLARDGKYYNGYIGSPDYRDDFKPEWDKAMEPLLKRLEALIEAGDEKNVAPTPQKPQ